MAADDEDEDNEDDEDEDIRRGGDAGRAIPALRPSRFRTRAIIRRLGRG
jgi:hypothetical protein